MNNKLSFSSTQKYETCPKMYELHYKKKLRSNALSSALVFGKAFDHAIAKSLEGGDGIKAFDEAWDKQEIKGKLTSIADLSDIEYFKSDLDVDLLTLDLRAKLDERKPSSVANIEDAVAWVNQGAFKKVPDNVTSYYKYACYLSLKVKGELMLQAFDRDIKPRLAKVISLQHMVELANSDGDTTVGYVDLIAQLDDGRVAIIDLKTASRPYEEDAVKLSSQLALYSFASDVEHDCCAYAVIMKKVKKDYNKTCSICGVANTSTHKSCPSTESGKRCGGDFILDPKFYVETQFLVDTIEDQVKDMVIDNFNQINKAIKHEIYPRYLKSCNDQYGRPCIYRDYCFRGSKEGLVEES